MNERIKLLAEKANAHETSFAYYRGEKKPENAVTLHSVDLELFAELIVKECANIVQDSPWQLPQGYKSVDQAKLVKKYFGVEE